MNTPELRLRLTGKQNCKAELYDKGGLVSERSEMLLFFRKSSSEITG
jgi:hypothetical protein